MRSLLTLLSAAALVATMGVAQAQNARSRGSASCHA